MNKDYFFLDALQEVLNQGYGIKESLEISYKITHHPYIKILLKNINNGEDIIESIKNLSLPLNFLEFFEFFSLRLTLSEAIKNSLTICKNLDSIKLKIKSKLTYPIILILFLIIFSLFSSIVLFPKVESLFSSFNIEQSIMFNILFLFIKLLPLVIFIITIILLFILLLFIFAIKNNKQTIIEKYLTLPYINYYVKKYFTLKFAIYFNELLKDKIDTNTIIVLLNKTMNKSDIKVMINTMHREIKKGNAFEKIISQLNYIDPLFTLMYELHLQNIDKVKDMQGYIDLTLNEITIKITKFMKYLLPTIYFLVAFFVIMVYLAIILPMMNIIGNI